jgi:alkylated DNA repair dioxygenase AlkB
MQLDLLAPEALIPGFRYQTDLIDAAEEQALAAWAATLSLQPFEFHGYLGNRRIASFGYQYDYGKRRVKAATPLPDLLRPLQDKVAQFSGHPSHAFVQAMVTEYAPGAPIGWHRDKPEFGEIVGISLLSPAHLRFRRQRGQGWERRSQIVAPRSAYLLAGAARQDWQHSIPPQKALRYSITFRTLAAAPDVRDFEK